MQVFSGRQAVEKLGNVYELSANYAGDLQSFPEGKLEWQSNCFFQCPCCSAIIVIGLWTGRPGFDSRQEV
jgi:hypothetical protein